MELTDICSVEHGAGRKRWDVVLWSAQGERCTLESFGRRLDADALANRVALFVQTWINDQHWNKETH